jgi:hypothetical protein
MAEETFIGQYWPHLTLEINLSAAGWHGRSGRGRKQGK